MALHIGRVQTLGASLLALFALVSCGGSDITLPGDTGPTSVVKMQGEGQSGPAGAELAGELVVRVLDDQENPVSGRTVSWVVGTGGGSVTPTTSTTDDSGLTRARWTLGPTPGGNTLRAVVSGGGEATFSATATTASSMTTITSHQPEPSDVGQAVTVEFTVTGTGGSPGGDVIVTVSGGSESCTGSVASGSCHITLTRPGNRRLTATYAGDDRFDGSFDTEDHRVDQAQPNQTPMAAYKPPICRPGVPCQFNDGSSDGDGEVVGWTWDFGDGPPTSEGKNPTHTYRREGTFTVRLTVRDNDGATDDVTHRVDVSTSPANSPPIANDDAYTTTSGVDFHVPGDNRLSLISNDTDPEFDNLYTMPIDDPITTFSGGSVTIGDDGSFDYTPPPAFTGTDSFTYTLTDRPPGTPGLTDTGTVTITITP